VSDLRLRRRLNLPTISTTFQGNAQAFQGSLSTVPMLILAALVVVYVILGILYESFIHPITILLTLRRRGSLRRAIRSSSGDGSMPITLRATPP
jgi:HAE1 family hydrophobic/amphiphilic exporter-1